MEASVNDDKDIKHNIIDNLGTFNINMKNKNTNIDTISVEVNRLSQEELADGWTQVLPSKYKQHQKHHFNIELSELPSHLWSKPLILHYLYSSDNLDDNNCFTINDNIYSYSINRSEHYSNIYNLYIEYNKNIKNNSIILDLYNYCLKYNINGWLVQTVNKYLISINLIKN